MYTHLCITMSTSLHISRTHTLVVSCNEQVITQNIFLCSCLTRQSLCNIYIIFLYMSQIKRHWHSLVCKNNDVCNKKTLNSRHCVALCRCHAVRPRSECRVEAVLCEVSNDRCRTGMFITGRCLLLYYKLRIIEMRASMRKRGCMHNETKVS